MTKGLEVESKINKDALFFFNYLKIVQLGTFFDLTSFQRLEQKSLKQFFGRNEDIADGDCQCCDFLLHMLTLSIFGYFCPKL